MNTFKEMYFPSSEARALNKRLRDEHERFLLENPDWVPNELRLLPKIIARTLNKMCPKTPLMVPLGWIDGTTWADMQERDRISQLPDSEKLKDVKAHNDAIRGRCFRIPRPYEVKPEEAAFKAVQAYAEVDRRVFNNETFDQTIPSEMLDAFNEFWERLAEPGEWWSGKERIAIADEIRKAHDKKVKPQNVPLNEISDKPKSIISPLTKEVVRKVTCESHKIDKEWAAQATELMGPGKYSELLSIVVNLLPVDIFCRLSGRPVVSLPVHKSGKPTKQIPEGIVSGEAHVPWVKDWIGPNVARALSYVPNDNQIRMKLVSSMYLGSDISKDSSQFTDLTKFISMRWDEEEPLNRAQVELIAARTSAINECFY